MMAITSSSSISVNAVRAKAGRQGCFNAFMMTGVIMTVQSPLATVPFAAQQKTLGGLAGALNAGASILGQVKGRKGAGTGAAFPEKKFLVID